jgi:hypothetical protein
LTWSHVDGIAARTLRAVIFTVLAMPKTPAPVPVPTLPAAMLLTCKECMFDLPVESEADVAPGNWLNVVFSLRAFVSVFVQEAIFTEVEVSPGVFLFIPRWLLPFEMCDASVVWSLSPTVAKPLLLLMACIDALAADVWMCALLEVTSPSRFNSVSILCDYQKALMCDISKMAGEKCSNQVEGKKRYPRW